MSHADAFVAVMEADAGAGGVNTLLTGGIYTYTETGRSGINRDSTPSAFDPTTRLLRPCAVVRDQEQTPDGGVADDRSQAVSYRQLVHIFLYQEGSATTSTLETVAARLHTLFAGQKVGGYQVHWAGTLNDQREPALERATLMRVTFAVRGMK